MNSIINNPNKLRKIKARENIESSIFRTETRTKARTRRHQHLLPKWTCQTTVFSDSPNPNGSTTARSERQAFTARVHWSVQAYPTTTLHFTTLHYERYQQKERREKHSTNTDGSCIQFSIGLFFLIDAASFSHSSRNGSNVHVKFVDWIPGICSALGMLVINSIEKSRLQADSFSYSGSGVAWKARFVLFLGFALLAGGLAGSVVSILYSYLYWLLYSI